MKHFTDQIALTVIAAIKEADLKVLQVRLADIQAQMNPAASRVADEALLQFSKIKGIHFCRFVILPPFTDYGLQQPHQLVYSANIDGSLDAHLQEIETSGSGAAFAAVFSCCIGYDCAVRDGDAVKGFIKKNRKRVHTFYRAYRGLSVDMIHAEDLLYQTIQAHLESKFFRAVPAAIVKKDIEAYVAATLPDRKAAEAIKLPDISLKGMALGLIALALISLAAALAAAYFLGIVWYAAALIVALAVAAAIYLRYLENHDAELRETDKDYQKIRQLVVMEDRIVQNQLTHLAILKKGIFRRTLQALGLWVLNIASIYSANKGKLGDIGSIHFARWSMIDKGRRLLFFSNFDGSWENYLSDFVDRAAPGLTLAWSNTREFPKTKWLVTEGATNEELFKSWARKYQEPTQVWYSAYKNLTVDNIYRNHRVALGLGKAMSDDEIKAWLKLL